MAHYYAEDQDVPLNPYKIRVTARDHALELWTGSGVFSREHLDKGTELLLNTCVLEPGWKVHDLGCGYGVVGLIVKIVEPSCDVFCSDVSKRAVFLTRKNAREHGVSLRVIRSDGYTKIDEDFDTILLNPPYVSGRKVIFRLFEEAKLHLKSGGLLQVVARHQKGGKMIKQKLVELFGNCDDSRKKSGFHLYVSRLH